MIYNLVFYHDDGYLATATERSRLDDRQFPCPDACGTRLDRPPLMLVPGPFDEFAATA